MSRHLKACSLPDQPKESTVEGFHLFVEDRYRTAYWMHLAAGPGALLSDLDFFCVEYGWNVVVT